MKLDEDEVIIFQPKIGFYTKIIDIILFILLIFSASFFVSMLGYYYIFLLFLNITTVILPFYIIYKCFDRIFSTPARLISNPVKNNFIKIIYFFISVLLVYFITFIAYKSDTDYRSIFFSSLLPLLFYYFIHRLFNKVVLTNKRVIYRNFFLIKKCIRLKDIVYIAILDPIDGGLSALLHDIQNIRTLCFKLPNKLFPESFNVPEPEDFKDKTLEYIESNIKENNLNQEIMRKSFWYKIGVYREWIIW